MPSISWEERVMLSPTPHQMPLYQLMKSIDEDLSAIYQESQHLQNYYALFHSQLEGYLDQQLSVYDGIKRLTREDERQEQLKEFRKKILKLKLMSPSKYRVGADNVLLHKELAFLNQYKKNTPTISMNVPHLHGSSVFETSMEFNYFEHRYFKELDNRKKLCLLCFSVFPQGAVIRKRLMLHWWVLEGYASSEEEAADYFEDLMCRGFIEPASDNKASSCRLHPFHRLVLVELAARARFFKFESCGEASSNFSGCFQACLKANSNNHDQELGKLHLLLNLSDQYLESIDEWLPKMTNLNFLYLGRWKASQSHHIILSHQNPKLIQQKVMRYVKLLSLQGFSNITSLPPWVTRMKNLEVLDLNSCFYLESIPESIRYLEKLTSLDMSNCSLLDHMPKGISLLKNLKVLKGFFISYGHDTHKTCTLDDLLNLKKLEKLSLYTDDQYFPWEWHVRVLQKMSTLTKLTIAWGVRDRYLKSSYLEHQIRFEAKLILPNLEKLHLKAFPDKDTPSWLKLENMGTIRLKKLYITGGRLRELDATESEIRMNVEVIRLRYLREMEMDWRRFQSLFPRLKYLEKFDCPKLSFFPCDAKGLWSN